MKSTNDGLRELYASSWSSLKQKSYASQFHKQKPSNPLLLCVNELYESADIKVVYFGQETNDWEGDYSKEIEHLLIVYRDFYLSDYCFKTHTPFWNGIFKCNERLRKEFSGKSVGFIWNNLIKIGVSGQKGTPSKDILEFQDEWFSIISKEMQILKPDIVIFFTGPYYDQFITKCFTDAKFTGHPIKGERRLAKVKSNRLPTTTVRTYHPNYLWRKRLFYDYLDNMIKRILDS